MIPSLLQQISAAACHHEPEPAPQPRGSGAATLLDLIASEGPIKTGALVKKSGLGCQQVWGMLKHHRKSGRVHFGDGKWSLGADFKGRDVNRSVRMLRAMGYTVQAPEREGA